MDYHPIGLGRVGGGGVNSLNATETGDKHQNDVQLEDKSSCYDTKFSKLMGKKCKESLSDISE